MPLFGPCSTATVFRSNLEVEHCFLVQVYQQLTSEYVQPTFKIKLMRTPKSWSS